MWVHTGLEVGSRYTGLTREQARELEDKLGKMRVTSMVIMSFGMLLCDQDW